MLHNYLTILLGHFMLGLQEWSQNAFMLISTSLNRAFELRTGSVASVHRLLTDDVTSLIDGILMHIESMTELTLVSLSAACYSVFYLFIIHNISFPVHFIKKIMSKLELACEIIKQQKHRRPGFVCLYPSNTVTPGSPSYNDSTQLLLACSFMTKRDFQLAYSCLESITYLGWEHFVGYMKAFLLFKERQYDQALQISWPLWKMKERAEDWTISKLSNFIGCCLFKKGCFRMSVKWFQKAINSESYLLPLWNLASAFKHTGRNNASLNILQVLEKASSVTSDAHATYLCCNCLSLQNQPEVSHVQTLYLLARQTLSFCQYSSSAKYFTRILHIVKEKPLEDLMRSIHFPTSALDIYIEASYAYLHAGMYDDCLETACSAAQRFPALNLAKQSELCFSWNTDIKTLPAESGSNHYRKISLSAAKLDGLYPFLLNNRTVHFGQNDAELCESVLMTNENDNNSLKPNNSITKDEGGKCQCPHNHVRSYRIAHLMIKASAKYSLNCDTEATDILRRALVATSDYEDIRENLGASMLSKGQDDSSATFLEESCSVCSDVISSSMSWIYNNLAVIYISKNRVKEAAHNLRVAVMHDSSNIDAIYNYCLLQIQLKQVDVARSYWEALRHRDDRIRSILASDSCNSSYTVTAGLLKSLNEALSFEV